jgi:hypothetical protein
MIDTELNIGAYFFRLLMLTASGSDSLAMNLKWYGSKRP